MRSTTRAGALQELADSPHARLARKPTQTLSTLVASPNGQVRLRGQPRYLFADGASLTVGTDGKLYAQSPTVSVVTGHCGRPSLARFPVAAAIDPNGQVPVRRRSPTRTAFHDRSARTRVEWLCLPHRPDERHAGCADREYDRLPPWRPTSCLTSRWATIPAGMFAAVSTAKAQLRLCNRPGPYACHRISRSACCWRLPIATSWHDDFGCRSRL